MQDLPIYLLCILAGCHTYIQDDRAMLNAGCTTKFDQQQLDLCFSERHWELADDLHNKLQLSYGGIDILPELYTSLDSLSAENLSVIICNLLTKNGQKFSAYLFEYNDEIAKDLAQNENLTNENRAALYYHMSQWQERCKQFYRI
jgi:hypothetical protein